MSDSDNRPDVRLARLQHLGDSGVLGAESHAAMRVDTDAGIHISRNSFQRRSYTARRAVAARVEVADELVGDLDQFSIGHVRRIRRVVTASEAARHI